jgi:hypothetical protein
VRAALQQPRAREVSAVAVVPVPPLWAVEGALLAPPLWAVEGALLAPPPEAAEVLPAWVEWVPEARCWLMDAPPPGVARGRPGRR